MANTLGGWCKAVAVWVVAFTSVIGVPTNLFLLLQGNSTGAVGLIAGALAIYAACKVFEWGPTGGNEFSSCAKLDQ